MFRVDSARPPASPPLDHSRTTGASTVTQGYNQRNQVVPLIVGALGGIGRPPRRPVPAFLACRASCRKRGRDGTKYSRFHPANYLSHHLAGIVTAAVFADTAHIVEEIVLLKTRVNGATPAAAAADPTYLPTERIALTYSVLLTCVAESCRLRAAHPSCV
jgi:hypothetical protein